MTLDKLLEKLLADLPLTQADYRLLFGQAPVPKIHCILVEGPNGEREPCCS